MQEDIDPFDMLEPVNILERLPKDFFEKIVRSIKNQSIHYFLFLRNRNNGKIEKKF